MSSTSTSPAGSPWSIAGTAFLHGGSIVMLLIAATILGWIARLDATLEAWMGELMGEKFVHSLPGALNWLMALLVAFGLPALLLTCHHSWQRLTVWLASLAVLSLWAPVLCLAAHRPQISTAWLASALAGLLVTIQLYWTARSSRTQ